MIKATCASRILKGLSMRDMKQSDLCALTGIPKSAMSQYCKGNFVPKQSRTALIAKALNVNEAWLMGYDVPPDRSDSYNDPLDSPLVQFAGPIAAYFDATPTEQHEYMPVPREWLGHRRPEDFFIAEVDGNSMYPHYQHGDFLLCVRCSDMGHSGRVGIMLTGNGEATLKRIEYQEGKDWIDLIPLNPEYAPRRIEGADLEQCRVVGRVVKVFRDVDEI